YCRTMLWPDARSKSPSTSLNTSWIEAADNTRNSPAFTTPCKASSATIAPAIRKAIERREEIARLNQVMSAPPFSGLGAALETGRLQGTGWLRLEPDGASLIT